MGSLRCLFGLLIVWIWTGCGEAQQSPCSIICSYNTQCVVNPPPKAVDECLSNCKPKFEQAKVRCKDYYREYASCLGRLPCERREECRQWQENIKTYCEDNNTAPTTKQQGCKMVGMGAGL